MKWTKTCTGKAKEMAIRLKRGMHPGHSLMGTMETKEQDKIEQPQVW